MKEKHYNNQVVTIIAFICSALREDKPSLYFTQIVSLLNLCSSCELFAQILPFQGLKRTRFFFLMGLKKG